MGGVRRVHCSGILPLRRLPVAVAEPQVHRRAERPRGFVKGACGGLGADRDLLRLPGAVPLAAGEGPLAGGLGGLRQGGCADVMGGQESKPCDATANERSLNAEINNGRLAMVAIVGLITQNGFLGTSGPGMWIPGA